MYTNLNATSSSKPTAFITKNKQRLKQYSSNVYLKNGDEFEIEVFNPSSTTVLAKVKINGEFISDTGLVVRPGERVYLERYFDIAKKFMFSTYTVDANNKEVDKAIQFNGDVEILFYDEEKSQLVPPKYLKRTLNSTYVDFYPTYKSLYSQSFMDSDVSIDSSLSFGTASLKETGQIEEGNNSNQNFTKVNKKFNYYTTAISKWKILPESEKPKQINDLPIYCRNCGTKKKKYKYCPNCGTKFENAETKVIYVDEPRYSYNDKLYVMYDINLPLHKVIENNPHKLIVVHKPSLSDDKTRAIIIEQ